MKRDNIALEKVAIQISELIGLEVEDIYKIRMELLCLVAEKVTKNVLKSTDSKEIFEASAVLKSNSEFCDWWLNWCAADDNAFLVDFNRSIIAYNPTKQLWEVMPMFQEELDIAYRMRKTLHVNYAASYVPKSICSLLNKQDNGKKEGNSIPRNGGRSTSSNALSNRKRS